MATDSFNDVRLRYELTAAGEVPLVLVHGGWGSHQQWDLVAPGLAESFQVLSYDRRGHSESEHPPGQARVRDNVGDLVALIERLGLAPAYVAGNSLGAAIAFLLAGERPDLLRGVIAHEPPYFSLLADDPAFAPIPEEVGKKLGSVMERIASGDHVGSAEEFTDTFFAPGEWAQLGREYQQTAIENAPTVLNELRDPEALQIEVGSVAVVFCPVLLTTGEKSPPIFAPVIGKLAEALPRVETLTFPDAGHIPHVTHPDAYVEATTAFIRKHEA